MKIPSRIEIKFFFPKSNPFNFQNCQIVLLQQSRSRPLFIFAVGVTKIHLMHGIRVIFFSNYVKRERSQQYFGIEFAVQTYQKWLANCFYRLKCPKHRKKVSLGVYSVVALDRWIERSYVSFNLFWGRGGWIFLISSYYCLVGEASGKANKSVAKHIPGSMGDMNARVTSSANEISRAHKLAMERGDKLNKLEDSAERMRNEAENYASSAHDLMVKYRDKKWYQI